MTTKKIYLASSWRNVHQPELISALRNENFEVYDFRNPQVQGPPAAPESGFSWKQVDSGWGRDRQDLLLRFRAMLAHPVAKAGFDADFSAMKWADTCVIALPSGRSAHLECGWMAGAGKKMVVYMPPATRRCVACLGGGWVDNGDPMRNDRCIPCEGTGDVMLWNFEPELMYLIGGGPENIVFDHTELLERLHASSDVPRDLPEIAWYIRHDHDSAHAAVRSLSLGGKKLLCDEPGHPLWVRLALATTQQECERCALALKNREAVRRASQKF
jgi:hypothetical protein